MITEAALVTISCVLFIQMGLCETIEKFLSVSFKIISCPKCCTFWTCLGVLIWHKNSIIDSVAASFIASYVATWLALLYDSLAILYNYAYESITPNPDTSEGAERPSCSTGPTETDSNAVS